MICGMSTENTKGCQSKSEAGQSKHEGDGSMKVFPICMACVCLLLLSACALLGGDGSAASVGPARTAEESPMQSESEIILDLLMAQSVEVAIPVFDPGLPKDEYSETPEGVWPELRRAEANRAAWKLKLAMDNSQAFSAVRVTPDAHASADIYILGTILESNGEDLELEVQVVDATGKSWYKRTYDYRNSVYWYDNPRNTGKDPFDPLYVEITDDVIEYLNKKKFDDLGQIRAVNKLRFAESFAPDAFHEYLSEKRGVVSAVAMPAADDPMLLRVDAVRIRDQMFMDSFQGHYQQFSADMNGPYLEWQKESGAQSRAAREARNAAITKGIIGALAVIAGGAAMANSGRNGNTDVNLGQLLGGVAVAAVGAEVIGSSIESSREATSYRASLNELAKSVNTEMYPRVVEMEDKTVTLTGTAAEQFEQWRELLDDIYQAEMLPNADIKVLDNQ